VQFLSGSTPSAFAKCTSSTTLRHEDTYAVSDSLVNTDTEPKAEPDTSTAQDVWADTDTGATSEMDYGKFLANEKVSDQL